MPNRIIKESIRTSKTVNAMTDFQFRVWIYLITYVDDYGRGSADPELIKGFVFPRRKRVSESDIEKALAELAGMGCISLYDVDGKPMLKITDWETMQPEAGRHTKEYAEWRKKVFERDNYTCRMCGKRGGKLRAHHIKRYRSAISERTVVENGITLCNDCHKLLHHMEGK